MTRPWFTTYCTIYCNYQSYTVICLSVCLFVHRAYGKRYQCRSDISRQWQEYSPTFGLFTGRYWHYLLMKIIHIEMQVHYFLILCIFVYLCNIPEINTWKRESLHLYEGSQFQIWLLYGNIIDTDVCGISAFLIPHFPPKTINWPH